MPGFETSTFSLSFLMILTSVSWMASSPWTLVMLVSSQTSSTENVFSPMPWTSVEAKVTVTPPGGLPW